MEIITIKKTMTEKSNTYLASFKKLVLYAANGSISTIVTYTLFVIISNLIDYRVTIVIVYIIGILMSYLLNRRTVFKVRGKLYLFVIIHVGMILLNLSITTLLVEEFNLIKEISQLIAIFIVFLVGYTLLNRYAFPNQIKKN